MIRQPLTAFQRLRRRAFSVVHTVLLYHKQRAIAIAAVLLMLFVVYLIRSSDEHLNTAAAEAQKPDVALIGKGLEMLHDLGAVGSVSTPRAEPTPSQSRTDILYNAFMQAVSSVPSATDQQLGLIVYGIKVTDGLSAEEQRSAKQCLEWEQQHHPIPGMSWGSLPQQHHADYDNVFDCNAFTAGAYYQQLYKDPAYRDYVAEEYYRMVQQRQREDEIVQWYEQQLKQTNHNVPSQDVTVVIARFDNNIDWIHRLDSQKFRIVTNNKKGGSPVASHEKYAQIVSLDHNKGDEATVFLRYIIDNYDKRIFSKYTAFVHHHEDAWHSRGSMVDRLNAFQFGRYRYMNLNYNRFECEPYEHENDWKGHYQALIAPFRDVPLPTTSVECHHISGQFVVSRERILAQPKAIYQHAYDYFVQNDVEGRSKLNYLERTWHMLFGESIQEVKLPMTWYTDVNRFRPTK